MIENAPKRLFLTVQAAILSLLLVLLGGVPLGAAAQEEQAPTVGEIVVDSYDCDTGQLTFHVPVTDLPHDPVDDGSLGYTVVGHYEQGPDSSVPGHGFNVEAQDAPYTGDLQLSVNVPPSNAADIPEGSSDSSGTIASIDISVGVGYESGTGASDTSSTTYTVDCGDATVPSSPEGDDGDGTVTDTADTTGAETVTDDGELIPICVQYFESAPSVQYLTEAQIDEIEAIWAAYDQSDIPPPQITGYPDPATGSCATENGVPIDYDPDSYTLICVPSGPEGTGPLVPQLAINQYLQESEDVILADPDTGDCSPDDASSPEPGEGDDGATVDPTSADTAVDDAVRGGNTAEDGDGTVTEDETNTEVASTDDPVETDSGGTADTEVINGTSGDDVTELPNTGAGRATNGSASILLVTLLSGIAVLCSFTAMRIRPRT